MESNSVNMVSGSGSGYDDSCPDDYIPTEGMPTEETWASSSTGTANPQPDGTGEMPMPTNHHNNARATIANLSLLLSYTLLGLLMK